MKDDWLTRECRDKDFEFTRPEGTTAVLADSLRARVKERVGVLTSRTIDEVFAALPPPSVEWHDQNVTPDSYVAGTVAEKRFRVRANVEVLRRWSG